MAWHLLSKNNRELQLDITSNLMSNFLSHLRQIGPSRQARRVDLFFSKAFSDLRISTGQA